MSPKLAQNFNVDIDYPPLQPLINQIICVDMGSEMLGDASVMHRTSAIILWVQDDIECQVMKAVREWQRVQQSFTLTVNLINSLGQRVESYVFINCRLTAIQHSMLNYSAKGDQIELEVKHPEDKYKHTSAFTTISGTISRANSDQTVMKLVQVGFDIMHHEFAS